MMMGGGEWCWMLCSCLRCREGRIGETLHIFNKRGFKPVNPQKEEEKNRCFKV
jgi:hypothetical protein